jgi:cholesterol transport system auxiliary component
MSKESASVKRFAMNAIATTIKWAVVTLALTLCACATDPLPDYRYYRLAAPKAQPALATPVFVGALEIEGFRADGVFGERPIVYGFADEPQKLSQYHFQLWSDPPGAIIQRRFIDVLSSMKVATRVTARAAPREQPTKLVGLIERLERVKHADVWHVAVKLRLRIDESRLLARRLTASHHPVVFERAYELDRVVPDDGLANSVETMGLLIDEIAVAFVRDLNAQRAPSP